MDGKPPIPPFAEQPYGPGRNRHIDLWILLSVVAFAIGVSAILGTTHAMYSHPSTVRPTEPVCNCPCCEAK